MDLRLRSYEPELLDGTGIPFEEIRRNMHELNVINTWLGGHAITVRGFKRLRDGRQDLHVCEIGCGGGDNLRAIARWCRKRHIRLRVTGIDINPDCINYAREHSREIDRAVWIVSDYRVAMLPDPPDIIFNSLFCHHFKDEDVSRCIAWMRDHAQLGFFINDLHRHGIAYHAIRLLTSAFSRSRLVRNDAPLSVSRGFRRTELERMAVAAIPGTEKRLWSLSWQWAFRWLLVYKKTEKTS